MKVFNTRQGPISKPEVSNADSSSGAWFQPGANEVSQDYLDRLTASGQKAMLHLFRVGYLTAAEPVELPPPAPAPEGPETIPADQITAMVAASADVALLEELFRRDSRPEVTEAIIARLRELDAMSPAKLEALQAKPAKAKRGRPKGAKNKTSEPPPAGPSVVSEPPPASE